MRAGFRLAAALGIVLLCSASPVCALHVDRLDADDTATLHAILDRLGEPIEVKKRDGTAILLSWDELYQPLDAPQRAWLDAFRRLRGAELGATSHYFGEALPADLVPVGAQHIRKDGADTALDPQYLPRNVHAAYTRMMDAMERGLDRRLLVESGYRSPAYQLYLFLYYMPKHDHSIRETNRHVALPGHSEHGASARQAIDFINQDGVSGEDDPEAFEVLPEYAWLQANAGAYGFAISYPRGNAHHTAFEPWHWHYEPAAADASAP